MNFIFAMAIMSATAIVQNAAFTAVSRARNSGDIWHHAKWSIASNGVWFVMQVTIWSSIWTAATNGALWKIVVAGVVYTLSTTFGATFMHARMLRTEHGKQKVGA